MTKLTITGIIVAGGIVAAGIFGFWLGSRRATAVSATDNVAVLTDELIRTTLVMESVNAGRRDEASRLLKNQAAGLVMTLNVVFANCAPDFGVCQQTVGQIRYLLAHPQLIECSPGESSLSNERVHSSMERVLEKATKLRNQGLERQIIKRHPDRNMRRTVLEQTIRQLDAQPPSPGNSDTRAAPEACRKEKMCSYAEALSFQGVSSETERLIATVGTTNGPFLRSACTVLTASGETVSATSADGSTVSWVRPEGMQGEVRCYGFENMAGMKLLVVKILVDAQSAHNTSKTNQP